MRKLILGAAALLALGCGAALAATKAKAPTPAQAIAAAVADPSRPADDTKRDGERKPADMLAFAEVKPGGKVVDFIPGKGYFTRLFSKAVGPTGKVYAAAPPERDGTPAAVKAVAAEAGY